MRKLFGGVLLAVGILVMTGSGLCSLAVIVGSLNGGLARGDFTYLLLPALLGGMPFMGGFGLFRWGRYLLRDPADAAPNDDELRRHFD